MSMCNAEFAPWSCSFRLWAVWGSINYLLTTYLLNLQNLKNDGPSCRDGKCRTMKMKDQIAVGLLVNAWPTSVIVKILSLVHSLAVNFQGRLKCKFFKYHHFSFTTRDILFRSQWRWQSANHGVRENVRTKRFEQFWKCNAEIYSLGIPFSDF